MDAGEFKKEFERVARFVCEEKGFAKPTGVFIKSEDCSGRAFTVHDVYEIHAGPNGEIVLELGKQLDADELETKVRER